MEALFGAELSLPVKFFIAFAIVLLLIGAAAYLVRRFGAGALGTATQRGRQPRLAVVDAAPIDNRRRLLIVRRDNVEHLLLVGGPTDVLVEANIVRASPAQTARDFQPTRPGAALDIPPSLAAAAENDLRAAEPVTRQRRQEAEPSPWPLHHAGETAVRAPVTPPTSQPAPSIAAPVAPAPPQVAPTIAPVQAEPLVHAIMTETSPPPVAQRPPEPLRPTIVAEAAVVPPSPPPPILASEDQNLADMAYRLEAALRRPMAGDETIIVPARPTQAAEPAPHPQEPPAPSLQRVRPAPTVVEPRTEPRQERPVYEGLEREMASLLGRPLGSS